MGIYICLKTLQQFKKSSMERAEACTRMDNIGSPSGPRVDYIGSADVNNG
jgi:hypothetical protein